MNKVHSISTTARQLLVAFGLSVLAALLIGAAPTHAQADSYSYTVQSGDGVTNLILDLADANDKDISPARAFKIAQDNGQKFLDNNLTVESDLPFTDGIGAFEDAGVTIAASDNQELFDDLTSAIDDSPDSGDDDIEVPADEGSDDEQADNQDGDDSDQANSDSEDSQDAEDSDETADGEAGDDQDNEDGEDDSVWPWIVGIAAVLGGLYYINSSRTEN